MLGKALRDNSNNNLKGGHEQPTVEIENLFGNLDSPAAKLPKSFSKDGCSNASLMNVVRSDW